MSQWTVIIDIGNCLTPFWHQAITSTNDDPFFKLDLKEHTLMKSK